MSKQTNATREQTKNHGDATVGKSKKPTPTKVDTDGHIEKAGQGLSKSLQPAYRFLTRNPKKTSMMKQFLLFIRDQRESAQKMAELSDDDISILVGRLEKLAELIKQARKN